MNQPAVSVIVPVYLAEKYLCRCLDSIKHQFFGNFEVILIDDGSSDDSGLICDNYTREDSRFNVIHKKHEGVSIARQTGLEAAKGEYVIHADPDDWMEPDWLQKLYDLIVEDCADMAICGFDIILPKGREKHLEEPTSLRTDDIINDLLCGRLHGSCWNKLIKKECFDKYNIGFQPQMNLYEDLYVICMLLTHNIKTVFLPQILYHYDSVINNNSIVRHKGNREILSQILFINTLSQLLSSDLYTNGWYHRKSHLKENIFFANNCEYDIVNTYPEINNRYIKESQQKHLWSINGCVSLCLRGYPLFAHF